VCVCRALSVKPHLSAGLGSLWTTTAGCEATAVGTLRFYAAVRPPAAEVSGNMTRPTIAYPNCRVIRTLLGPTAQSGQCKQARRWVCFCLASNTFVLVCVSAQTCWTRSRTARRSSVRWIWLPVASASLMRCLLRCRVLRHADGRRRMVSKQTSVSGSD
jgi:hypothetical protein